MLGIGGTILGGGAVFTCIHSCFIWQKGCFNRLDLTMFSSVQELTLASSCWQITQRLQMNKFLSSSVLRLNTKVDVWMRLKHPLLCVAVWDSIYYLN